eukprot:348313-Hanusia_phi.AAC.2
MFEIADPGVEAERRLIQKDALEHARKQHGTDEDLLVIDVENLMVPGLMTSHDVTTLQQECTDQNSSESGEGEILLRCKRKGEKSWELPTWVECLNRVNK